MQKERQIQKDDYLHLLFGKPFRFSAIIQGLAYGLAKIIFNTIASYSCTTMMCLCGPG